MIVDRNGMRTFGISVYIRAPLKCKAHQYNVSYIEFGIRIRVLFFLRVTARLKILSNNMYVGRMAVLSVSSVSYSL